MLDSLNRIKKLNLWRFMSSNNSGKYRIRLDTRSVTSEYKGSMYLLLEEHRYGYRHRKEPVFGSIAHSNGRHDWSIIDELRWDYKTNKIDWPQL